MPRKIAEGPAPAGYRYFTCHPDSALPGRGSIKGGARLSGMVGPQRMTIFTPACGNFLPLSDLNQASNSASQYRKSIQLSCKWFGGNFRPILRNSSAAGWRGGLRRCSPV
jgi:hypothetical protein